MGLRGFCFWREKGFIILFPSFLPSRCHFGFSVLSYSGSSYFYEEKQGWSEREKEGKAF